MEQSVVAGAARGVQLHAASCVASLKQVGGVCALRNRLSRCSRAIQRCAFALHNACGYNDPSYKFANKS